MIDLYGAMRGAINGLGVHQDNIGITGRNIENADNPNYNRLIADVTTDVNGNARLGRVTRVIDDWVERNRLVQSSAVSYEGVKHDYLSRVKELFGTHSDFDDLKFESIASDFRGAVDDFFTKMQDLSSNPFDYTLKEFAVTKAEDLARLVQQISDELAKMRVKAEIDFGNSVNILNEKLSQVHELNQSIAIAPKEDQILADMEDKRDRLLLDIAEYFDINVTIAHNGKAYVVAGEGYVLVDDFLRELNYDVKPLPVDSYDSLIVRYADDPKSYVAGDLVVDFSDIFSGKFKALAELRDRDLPMVIEQLNSFADIFARTVNEVYSSGTSYPGLTSLRSTNAMAGFEHFDIDGTVIVAVLDKSGHAIEDFNGNLVRPLVVDVADKTVRAVIEEINGFFKYNLNSVEFDNGVRDIQLKNMARDEGFLQVAVVVDNAGFDNAVVKVEDARVLFYNTGDWMNRELTELPQYFDVPIYVEAAPGEVATSTQILTFDITDLPTAVEEFTVSISLKVDGLPTVVDYKILNTNNSRFYASAASGVGVKLVQNGSGGTQYLEARLVNEAGFELDNNYEPGFIDIRVLEPQKYNIVLDAGDTRKRFVDSQVNFVHDLGFNNLFVESRDISDAAKEFRVNADLLRDPSRLNVGLLRSLDSPLVSSHAYEIGLGDGEIAMQIANLGHQQMSFGDTGYLPAMNSTLAAYTTEISERAHFLSYEAEMRHDNEKAFQKVWEDKHNAIGGVNIEDELAKVMMLEYYYISSNKNLAIIRELMDEFLKSI